MAKAVSALREAGVNGSCASLLRKGPYTRLSRSTEAGYPIIKDIEERKATSFGPLPSKGGGVLSARGRDFHIHVRQDLSIGYLSHSWQSVQSYLQETLTFLQLTAEAVAMLNASNK